MDNLIFSLNATVPVFFVIFIGWLLRRVGVLGDTFSDVNNRLAFRILFPVLLFRDIAATDLHETFDAKFLIFCFLVTLVCFCVLWVLARLFCKPRESIGSFVQGSMRGSAAILGVAFVENMYGGSGMVPMMILAAVPVYNVGSVIILTCYSSEKPKGGQLRQVVLSVLTNPMILGIAAGIPFAIFHVDFPQMVDKCIGNLASLTTPLALLLVGAGFDFQQAKEKKALAGIATVIKLLVLPAVFLPIAVAFGFRGQALIAILIMLGSPATVSSYIMAKSMHNDAALSCSIVVLTTLFSAVSVTTLIFILRTLQLV